MRMLCLIKNLLPMVAEILSLLKPSIAFCKYSLTGRGNFLTNAVGVGANNCSLLPPSKSRWCWLSEFGRARLQPVFHQNTHLRAIPSASLSQVITPIVLDSLCHHRPQPLEGPTLNQIEIPPSKLYGRLGLLCRRSRRLWPGS